MRGAHETITLCDNGPTILPVLGIKRNTYYYSKLRSSHVNDHAVAPEAEAKACSQSMCIVDYEAVNTMEY